MGNELMHAACSEKKLKQSILVNLLPVLAASLLVGGMCCVLMDRAGNIGAGIAIAAVLVIGMCGFEMLMLTKQKKLLPRTRISVCENGIEGTYMQSFSATADFSLTYAEIRKVQARNINLVIVPVSGRAFTLYADEAEQLAEAIRSRLA